MKNRILKLYLPLATLLLVAFATAQPVEPPNEPPKLAHAILDAPPEIEAIAASLGIEQIAFVPHSFYTTGTPEVRTFNIEKANKKLDTISAICDGATWIVTDIEKKHRDVIRRPDKYSDAEVKAAVEQYVACWSWFRSHWPSAKIFEWNLTNAREADVYTFAENLVLKHLDGFAVSIFYRDKNNWQRVREEVVAHADSLVAGTDKIVIAGIHERHKIKHEGGVTEFAPLSRDIVDAMIEVALGADIVFFWSPTYKRIDNPAGSANVLSEILAGVDNPEQQINARVVLVLAEMRLKAEAVDGD